MKRNYLRGIGIGIILSALLMGIFTGSKKMTDQEVKERAKQLGMVEQQEVVLSDLKESEEDTSSNEVVQSSKDVENSDISERESAVESSETVESTEAVESNETTESEAAAESSEETESVETVESSEAVESSETTESESTVESSEATESSESVESSETAQSSEAKESSSPSESSETPESSTATESSEATSTAANGSETVTIVVKNCSSSLQLAKIVADAGLVPDAKAFDDFLCKNGYDRKINNGTFEIPVGSTEEEIAKIVTTKKKK